MMPPPDKQLQLMLILIVGFNTIPHTFQLPAWITVSAVTFLTWAGLHHYRGIPLPPRWLRAILTIGGAVGVAFQWRTIMGQEPATGLLVYLAGLKLLESTKYRDAMLVIFTSYFLLMAHLLVSQSLPSTLYMGLDVMLITALMFHLHKRDRRSSLRSLRPAMRLLALALPVWMFLFVAFPRFSTGFWRLNVQPATQTGFSDDMSPGEISRLAESEAPAFRVEFKNNRRPGFEGMYWRGSILVTNEAGMKWVRPKDSFPQERERTGVQSGATIIQTVTLEPGYRNWLFGLDAPRSIEFSDPKKSGLVRALPGQIFETEKPLDQRVLYEVYSNPVSRALDLSAKERELYLQTSADLTEDVRALAAKLKADAPANANATELSRRLLLWFDEEKFVYTKEPGALRTGLLREFLFETKRGFCEHYSAAYATLMRLMGVPSRVVLGFQGGQPNAFGDYITVRELDAHAWTEIWDENEKRWTRVDPTATIEPMRIRLGGDFNLLDPANADQFTPEMIQAGLNRTALARYVFRTLQAWDAFAMQYNSFLLKYDFTYQQEMFSKLGLGKANRMVFFFWVAAGVVMFLLILQFILRRQALREDPLLEGYHALCDRFERAGLKRRPNEGPLDFLARARAFRPEQADELDRLGQEFIRLRYGRDSQRSAQESPDRALQDRIRSFRRAAKTFKLTSPRQQG